MFGNVFKDKKILITGHTGFKGSWLSLWLSSLGAEVVGLSLNIPTEPSNYMACQLENFVKWHRADVRDAQKIKKIISDYQPDFLFHLAAQALVRESYIDPLKTFEVNAIGSANVLDALKMSTNMVVAIMITSDKAYDNVEWVWGYRESDRLGGKDPYSASKGMAELAIKAYIYSFYNEENSRVRVGITRAGNVIGGGDWAKDRIVPDCMSAWSDNKIVDIRNPHATRPWQHVLEPLSGYLRLGMKLTQDASLHGEAYNFGPSANQNYSVHRLISEMQKYWSSVRWRDVSKKKKSFHEAGLLKLNCDKALSDLDWLPNLTFEETVKFTTRWYKTFYQDPD